MVEQAGLAYLRAVQIRIRRDHFTARPTAFDDQQSGRREDPDARPRHVA